MTEQSHVIDVRRWVEEAVAAGRFELPITAYPPPGELDGEPFDFRAAVYAVLVALGNGNPIELPPDIDAEHFKRALALVASYL
jgi:hypothetical protein